MSLCSHSKSLGTRSNGGVKDEFSILSEGRKKLMQWRDGEKKTRDCLLGGSTDGKVKGHFDTTRATDLMVVRPNLLHQIV